VHLVEKPIAAIRQAMRGFRDSIRAAIAGHRSVIQTAIAPRFFKTTGE